MSQHLAKLLLLQLEALFAVQLARDMNVVLHVDVNLGLGYRLIVFLFIWQRDGCTKAAAPQPRKVLAESLLHLQEVLIDLWIGHVRQLNIYIFHLDALVVQVHFPHVFEEVREVLDGVSGVIVHLHLVSDPPSEILQLILVVEARIDEYNIPIVLAMTDHSADGLVQCTGRLLVVPVPASILTWLIQLLGLLSQIGALQNRLGIVVHRVRNADKYDGSAGLVREVETLTDLASAHSEDDGAPLVQIHVVVVALNDLTV